MEDQEIDKGFWVDGIRVPDKDGKVSGNHMSGYNGRIKVALGKPKTDGSSWKMEFKTVLPEHIHTKLSGKTVVRVRDMFKSEPSQNDYRDLKKTIGAYSLEHLIERFKEIVDDFLFIVNDENRPKEKMIYVNWGHNLALSRSSGNGCKMGKIAELNFHFFVGYYNGQSIYDIDHKLFNTTSYNREILEYKTIPWTQEREDFFEKVYANFEALRDRLDEFFSSLNAKTIDSHITNFKLLT